MNYFNKLFVVFMLLITLFACDRFAHNFAPVNPQETPIENFKNSLTNIISSLDPSDEDSLSALYSENYLNNGWTKQDAIDYFINITLQDSVILVVDSLQFSQATNEFQWYFSAYNQKETFADTTFNDILILSDSTYLFYGNQSYGKSNVFVELASATNCSNCPDISTKLKELEAENDNFIFLTACYNKPDTPSDYLDDFIWYYPFAGVFPTSFFQGQFKLEGSTQAVIDEYDARTSQISDWEAEAVISNIQVVSTKTDVTGSVDLQISDEVLLDNMYLRCALIEKESTLQYYHSDYMHNVVFGYEKILIMNHSETVNFNIQSYYDTLPEDTSIIFWLQRMPTDYDTETCKVISVRKQEL